MNICWPRAPISERRALYLETITACLANLGIPVWPSPSGSPKIVYLGQGSDAVVVEAHPHSAARSRARAVCVMQGPGRQHRG